MTVSADGTEHSVMLEAYLEAKSCLDIPFWKNNVDLIDENHFLAWADNALASGRLTSYDHKFYVRCSETIARFRQEPKTRWAKFGVIEDQPGYADNPCRFIMAYQLEDGCIECHVATDTRVLTCKRIII